MLPFTTEQFLGIFQRYNEAVWPTQLVLFVVGLLAVVLAIWKTRFSDFAVSLTLAGVWLWMGVVYHILFFSAINPAAFAFGVVFIVQGLLFFCAGPVQKRLSIGVGKDWSTFLGGCTLFYALLVYPLLGLMLGHAYPRHPTFGVPCPTTIFTFGLLLWTDRRVPSYLLIIPALWAIIGSSAVFLLGVWQDLGLLVAGVVTIPTLRLRTRPTTGGQ